MYLQGKGVPEPVPDSSPESLRTSLSSLWFAVTTPDVYVLFSFPNLDGGDRSLEIIAS